jgi:hypothetical protein
MGEPRPCLYIGSTSYDVSTPREAIAYFTEPLTSSRDEADGPIPAPAIPTGETTDHNWVSRQLAQFDHIRAFRRLKRGTFGESGRYWGIPAYVARKGQVADVDDINLLLADRARDEFPVWQAVCAEAGLGDQRFQVGINVVEILLFALRFGAKKQLEPFIEANRREAAAIWELTGGKAFFLVETPTATILANMTRGNRALLDWYATTFERLLRTLPDGAGWGFHFCDGRLGGRAIGDHGIFRALGVRKILYKTRYTVAMSNHILRHLEDAGLTPELAQYPLALGDRAPSLDVRDHADYRDLHIPDGMRVYAGAVSDKLSFDEHARLYQALDDVVGQRVGMATTCGFGSSDLAAMKHCLDVTRRLAYV